MPNVDRAQIIHQEVDAVAQASWLGRYGRHRGLNASLGPLGKSVRRCVVRSRDRRAADRYRNRNRSRDQQMNAHPPPVFDDRVSTPAIHASRSTRQPSPIWSRWSARALAFVRSRADAGYPCQPPWLSARNDRSPPETDSANLCLSAAWPLGFGRSPKKARIPAFAGMSGGGGELARLSEAHVGPALALDGIGASGPGLGQGSRSATAKRRPCGPSLSKARSEAKMAYKT
jgi:hypothetical protein